MRALGAVYEPGGLCPFARNTTKSPGPPPHLLVQAVAPYSASLISPVQHNDPATVYITFSMARLS